jgi:hypothetical protein
LNSAYSQTNTASGGVAPYTFGVTSGNPPPGVTLSSGGILSGTPTSTGNYTFTVTATDANSCSGNQSFTVMVKKAPAILTQPQSQTVPSGSNGVLAVVADGMPAPVYQWCFNSTNVTNAVSASMTITNFQGSNEGSYWVTASNELGSATSQVAVLFLANPLRFVNPGMGSNGGFQFRAVGPAGSNFVVDGSTDLLNWTSLFTNSAPLGILDFTNQNVTAPSSQFFRVRLLP